MYAGLDLQKMFADIETRYTSRKDLTTDLVLVNSVNFIRGYSYDKITKNLKNPEKAAMNRLKVFHGAKPGPTDVTLGRVTLLAPMCHPDFFH